MEQEFKGMLGLKDKKILSELEMNARIAYSQLGKKVGLSKQVVKYRVAQLEKKKIIEQYFSIVDLARIGFQIYVVYFKLFKISTKKEEEWREKIEKNKFVMAAGKNAGEWDMTIVLKCKNEVELDKILNEITKGKKENILKKKITSEIKSSYFSMNILLDKGLKEASTGKKENIFVDKKDLKIISELSKNSRISLLDLAGELNMSANGVKERIKKLEKNRIIIAYKTKINYEKLGYLHFRVFLHVKDFEDELYEKIKFFFKSKGVVESISKYIGYADVDFRCYSKNVLEFYKLVSEIKDKFVNDILSVDSMIIFDWEKMKYY